MIISSQCLPSSKKIQRKKNHDKKAQEFMQKIKASHKNICFFIDPLVCHRIYRDFLIPNHQPNSGESIYHFKSFLAYKSLAQVHVREEGVVLQFTDYISEYISPLGLLQKRLDSVGNKHCHELAEYLPSYYENFQNDGFSEEKKKTKFGQNEPLTSIYSDSGLLLQEIDKIFTNSIEDFLFITVYQTFKGYDDRLHMLGFNKNLISLLTSEDKIDNIFKNDLIDELLQIFADNSFDHYMEEFNAFLKSFPIKELKGKFNPITDVYIREINTIFGQFKVNLCLKNVSVMINDNKYHLICSVFDDKNSVLKSLLKEKSKRKGTEKIPNADKDWAQLFQFYYRKEK